jgi:hypothetical protein
MAYVVLIYIVPIYKGWEAMDVLNITYSIRMHVLMVSLFCEKVGVVARILVQDEGCLSRTIVF